MGEDAAGCAARLRALGAEGAPVVDGMGRLRGALTAVELARIESGAMDEDYARLGGLTEGEDLCEPLRASVRKRLPWLLALLALGLVVSSVVGRVRAGGVAPAASSSPSSPWCWTWRATWARSRWPSPSAC